MGNGSDEARGTRYQNSIVVNGNGSATGAMVTGAGGKAVYNEQRAAEPSAVLSAELAELTQLVARHRATIDDTELLLRDTAELLAALSARRPDRDNIRMILSQIAGRGTALVAVLEVLEKTREIVGRIVG